MSEHYRIISTELGWIGFVASSRGLRHVWLPLRSATDARRTIRRTYPEAVEQEDLMEAFADSLASYAHGENVDFKVELDTSGFGAFQVDVWNALRRVGYGRTISYKGLAERVGRPHAARAVGNAMRHNPCPFVVPCHRVVKSDGSIGGFGGTSGISLKRRLLALEAE